MEQTQTIGKRICAHRKKLGLTQDQLAEKVGVSPQAVSKWENDLSCPDISTLPVLARIFGVTTDELLGVEPKQPPLEAEVIEDDDEPEGIHISADNVLDFRIDPKRSGTLAFAVWVIAIGTMMLAGSFLNLNVDFWDAAWTTGLTVWGLHSVIKRVSFPGVIATLAGLYFMAEELALLDLNLGWNLLLPLLIVIFGVSLLFDGLGRKRKGRHIHVNGPGKGVYNVQLCDGVLHYSESFSDSSYRVSCDLFKGGEIKVSFGDYNFDLTGVKALAPDCTLVLNSSFCDTKVLVPGRFRAEIAADSSFCDIDFTGHCDEAPEAVLYINGSLSFGDLTIEYV